MLGGMLKRGARGLWFTLAAVALFMVGCGAAAGASPEPEVPEASTEQPTAMAGPASAPAEQTAAPAQPQTVDAQYVSADGGYEDTDPSALTVFRADLEPYGAWVEDPVYGLVWVPNAAQVGPDFAPYVSGGHWALTEDAEWLWVSDYEWGWVAFHYGRWVWIPGTGWAWIPGRAYAPAWVVWRVGEPGYDYIGWAPMPPGYYWSGGVAVALWVYPPAPYVFCETGYVFHDHVHTHILIGAHMHDAARHTHHHHGHGQEWYGGSRHGARPHGPSTSEARIPAAAVPRTPAQPHPRAIAAARPGGVKAASPSVGGHTAALRGGAAGASGRDAMKPSGTGVRGREVSSPTYRGQGSRAVTPARRARPLAEAPAYRTGTPPAGVDSRRATPRTWGNPQDATRARGSAQPGSAAAPSRWSRGSATGSPARRPAAQQPYVPNARSSQPVTSPYRPYGGNSRGPSHVGPGQSVQPQGPAVHPSSKPAARPGKKRGSARGR